jgi:predicted outer membrane repeat protein
VLGSNSDYKPCSPYIGTKSKYSSYQSYIVVDFDGDGAVSCSSYAGETDPIPDVHPWNTNTDCNISPAVTFQGNRAVSDLLLPPSYGGGIYAMNWRNIIWKMGPSMTMGGDYGEHAINITKCKPSMHTFQNNSAITSGGGLYVSSSSKNSDDWVKDVIENVVFKRNRAGLSGELNFCFPGQPQETSGPDLFFSSLLFIIRWWYVCG